MGRSEDELRIYRTRLEESITELEVQTIDASKKLSLSRDLPAMKLLNAFGAGACPIFAVGNEVVSMGPPPLGELIELIRAKVKATPVG